MRLYNVVAKIRSARVVTHESARHGRGSAFVAQGTVRRMAEQVRVSVQLMRAEGGDLLWSETFDEPLENASAGQFGRASFAAQTIEAIVRSAHRAATLSTRDEEARRQFYHGLRAVDSLFSRPWGIRGDARFQRALRRLEAIEALGSPTRSVATRSGVSE